MKRIHTGNNGKTPPILPMHVNLSGIIDKCYRSL